MKVETLLPLGKLDPGLRAAEKPLDITRVAEDARLVEALGYDGLVVEETKDDPFIVLALAAQATTRLRIGTAVAIAFPRSPTVTALSAWTLQKLSGGRLTLGLGSQVKGHIERRYGLKWSPPGPWMRDYVGAMRAVWQAWQTGGQPAFESAHYNISLTVPLFNPGPIEHPAIPVHLAAVNPYMCQVAGEVAEGLRPHPVCTPRYIREVMLPSMRKGAAKAGREAGALKVAMKPLIATAPDQATLQARIRDVRARVSFYASTPAYRRAFEIEGLSDLASELSVLSKAQRWEEMSERISDEVLNTYATVGTYDEIAGKLRERYGGLVDSVEFSIPVERDADRERLQALVAELSTA
ncbi:MAG TPA: TIGR03617 family F420-dependent LLM class oxidoreductase [Alphaproteobacteria bacterium]|nr:TIGR03617 family F420-dependent LLM class oxidoreductase [Alphaproteobacteria bacterium]